MFALIPKRYREFDPPARRRLSTDFPYAIIYIIEPTYVWIIAVMYMKRAWVLARAALTSPWILP